MMKYIQPVETALAEGRTVSIEIHARDMMTLEADNWKIPVVPGLPVRITYLLPKPGAPKMSAWLRSIADIAERYEESNASD